MDRSVCMRASSLSRMDEETFRRQHLFSKTMDDSGDHWRSTAEVTVSADDQVGLRAARLDVSFVSDSRALTIVPGDELRIGITTYSRHVTNKPPQCSKVRFQLHEDPKVASRA